MAVFASTADPEDLARRVVGVVKLGSVFAWELRSGHLRHVDTRGAGGVGFFKVTITETAVKFSLLGAKKTPSFDGASYAYHHGRLTELLLSHFSDAITRVHATPFPGR